MITSTVKTFERFPELTAAIEALTLRALDAAAHAGQAVADDRASGITTFSIVPAQRSLEGFSAGIRAHNSIWRVFDKGSLGKRTARLKRPGLRKTDWNVERRGSVYTAHRGDVSGKGVDARTISNPARTAGRHALLAALTR
jgi:hypothetical protein